MPLRRRKPLREHTRADRREPGPAGSGQSRGAQRPHPVDRARACSGTACGCRALQQERRRVWRCAPAPSPSIRSNTGRGAADDPWRSHGGDQSTARSKTCVTRPVRAAGALGARCSAERARRTGDGPGVDQTARDGSTGMHVREVDSGAWSGRLPPLYDHGAIGRRHTATDTT